MEPPVHHNSTSPKGLVSKMKKLWTRMADILRSEEIEYAELWGALMTLTWGVGLLFVRQPALELPPQFLGICLIVVSVIHLAGIRESSYRLRRWGALFSAVAWAFVGAEVTDAGNAWAFVMCPSCLGFAVAATWGYRRMGQVHEARLRGAHQKFVT